MIYIGTASWNIPKIAMDSFSREGSHLVRYSKKFNAVEINTSFYKDHLAKSYAKWAASTPDDFRFSVKLNQRFTHSCEEASTLELSDSLESISCLDEKWRALLVQFPAGKIFNNSSMNKMYKIMRKRFSGIIAVEPRNLSWASEESLELMREYNITKVTADPEKCPGIEIGKEKYIRMHGSPEIYRSNYEDEALVKLEIELENHEHEAWCIFDNTTFGYATMNALSLAHKKEFYGNTQLIESSNLIRH